jgi:hypothetical protein
MGRSYNIELISNYYNVVASPSEADVIIYNEIPIYKTSSEVKICRMFSYLLEKIEETSIVPIFICSYSLYFNICPNVELTKEAYDKLSIMLSSDEQTIFDTAWQILWTYDYNKHKYEILNLVSDCNEKSYYWRTQDKKSQLQFSNFKAQFTNREFFK